MAVTRDLPARDKCPPPPFIIFPALSTAERFCNAFLDTVARDKFAELDTTRVPERADTLDAARFTAGLAVTITFLERRAFVERAMTDVAERLSAALAFNVDCPRTKILEFILRELRGCPPSANEKHETPTNSTTTT